ncbi:MAG: hypothetical protein QOD54_635 [Sphingomonadales bacterium]|nr:hypothetical protein [Sphingomonadales bacterium]
MASASFRGKFYPLFTLFGAYRPRAGQLFTGQWEEFGMVGGIAIAMFVALVGFGGKYFGWSDPDGKVQLALVTSFILGIIGGFKSRG